MISHEIPDSQWLKLGIDIFTISNQNYLIVIDYYSKFVEIELLKHDTRSEDIINKLKSIFARHGIPKL